MNKLFSAGVRMILAFFFGCVIVALFIRFYTQFAEFTGFINSDWYESVTFWSRTIVSAVVVWMLLGGPHMNDSE